MSGNTPPVAAPTTPALPMRQATQKANEHATFAGQCEDRAVGSDTINLIAVYYNNSANSVQIAVSTPEMRNAMKGALQSMRDVHKQKALEFLTMAAEAEKV